MNAIYDLIIEPIVFVLEIVFLLANRVLSNAGLSIICVSFAVTILTMPLYKRAEEIQDTERKTKARLDRWVTHINKTFKGDERIMLLNTYYRQQNYKPIYSMRSSLSLLLQVPFFIAAYRYISELSLLNGTSFALIQDLGSPDHLLKIGAYSVNILPILMTIINCISGMIYSKGFPAKEKLQLYGIAVVFLILLYNRPSGLVLYWTMNNVLSLIKNIFTKVVKNPLRIIAYTLPLTTIGGSLSILYIKKTINLNVLLIVALLIFLSFFPLIKLKKGTLIHNEVNSMNDGLVKHFVMGGVFLSLFVGVYIPIGVIGSAPDEFVNIYSYTNPLRYVLNTFCISAGFYIVWAGIMYYLMGRCGKHRFALCYWLISLIAVANFFFFGRKLGTVSSSLVFDLEPSFSMKEMGINSICILILLCALFVVWKLKRRLITKVYSVLICVIVVLSCRNIFAIQSELKNIGTINDLEDETEIEPIIHLSTNGKNVIVLMLDRAIGSYIPFIFDEKPELKDIYSGFTYYANTISYGLCTNYGAPALFGGYEYTPLAMNNRNTELLQEKNDEALKIMPVVFLNNGYDVTVCDPPYAGYSWIPDLSIYSEYPQITTFNTEGRYTSTIGNEYVMYSTKQQERNFFFYSAMKISPVVIQPFVYDSGNYLSTSSTTTISYDFLNSYSVLSNLNNLTEIKNDDKNTFLMMNNRTTHNPTILQKPDYSPSITVDNSVYENNEPYQVDGRIMDMATTEQIAHYHVNMLSYLCIGEWINYLKENNVYDNTRIIIVADHGFRLRQFSEWDLWEDNEVECLNPVLLVKEFNSSGFSTSYEFMTNADVPTIAFADTVDNPVNPFTANVIDDEAKQNDVQYVTTNWYWDISENNGTMFEEGNGHWYSVHDNIFDPENWVQLNGYPQE